MATDWIEVSDPSALPASPVVSVHMLAYNHGPYLADAIEGVIAQQTDFPMELVIGEDCSPDNTRQIALDYERVYPQLIRVIYSDRNVGGAANYLRALGSCKGQYIAFCEGDDYWHHPGKLQLQVDFLSTHPDYVMVHSDYDYRVGDRVLRSVMRNENRHVPEGDAYQALQMGNWIGTATTVYRIDVMRSFEHTDFASRDYRFGDYSRLLYASLQGKFGYINESLATYRYMDGSAMNSGYQSTLKLRQSVRQCRLDFIRDTGVVPQGQLDIERNELRLIYACAYLAGDLDAFAEVSRWLSEHDPQGSQSARHYLRRFIIRVPPLLSLVRLRARRTWRSAIKKRYEALAT